jgi:hypothetical protein
MAYPYSNLYGDISITVTNAGIDSKPMDVSAGLPIIDQLADILVRHGITKAASLNANGQLAFKLQNEANDDLVTGETFAQQGIHDGDILDIVEVVE